MICIYAIINILDDKCYVGQASDKNYRWQVHRKELRGFYHHSILLQRAWSKHGEGNFIFTVLEVLDNTENLTKREQHWIDTLKPEYNIAKVAGSCLGVKRSEKSIEKMRQSHLGKSWHTEESKRLASERMIGNTYNNGIKQTPERIEARAKLHRGKPKSEDHKAKIAEGNRGKIVSAETRERMRRSAISRYKTNPVSDETRKKLSEAAYRQWNDS